MKWRRIYSTADGKFVVEGDPRGEFLAFGEGDELPSDVFVEGDEAPAKSVKASANKAAARSADK